jgi:DNA ligase 1
MKQFAQLFTELDRTNKTNSKVDALVRYFETAHPEDALWAIALLSDRRPGRPVTSTQLRNWAAEVANIPYWLFEESYHIVGDLAETVAMLVDKIEGAELSSLSHWMQEIQAWRKLEETEKKGKVISAWQQMDYAEKFVFNKLITGGFRVGVSQKLMVKALSRHTGLSENTLAARLMGKWEPDSITWQSLLFPVGDDYDISQPYPFCLAYALEQAPASLGDVSDWMAEYKWDGIRGQLVHRGGEVFVWSRGEELITGKFPEFEVLIDRIPDGTVLDGEILPFRDGKPMSFGKLQTRIGRKTVGKKLLTDVPVCLVAYDIMEWEGHDIRARPFHERRAILEQVVAGADHPVLLLSDKIDAGTWEDMAAHREKARYVNAEGLMLKRLGSPYHTGRKVGDWWKWKVDPLSVDGVLIYAMQGHGRRANLYTDYTFAVWHEGQLVPFTKAYSGLTDAEFKQVDAFVRKNTLERFGPVRSVKPELVFELAFEGIQASPRHKSGVALRFPRMKRWRKDKPTHEANTLEDLRQLLRAFEADH